MVAIIKLREVLNCLSAVSLCDVKNFNIFFVILSGFLNSKFSKLDPFKSGILPAFVPIFIFSIFQSVDWYICANGLAMISSVGLTLNIANNDKTRNTRLQG